MARPKVNIGLMNGGLGIALTNAFGNSAVLVSSPVAPVAGYGVAFIVKSAEQAKTAFAQTGNEDVLDAFVAGFFAEGPAGTPVVVLALAEDTTLTQMATEANLDKLYAEGVDVKLISLIKFPSEDYTPTITTGFDAEVFTAVTAMQTLANTWLGRKKPFCFFVQGYGNTGVVANLKDYITGTSKNGHIVAFEIDANGATATLLVAGRAARVEPQENIGKIKRGSLVIDDTAAITIGGVAIATFSSTDLDTLYDKRYIAIEKNEVEAGYVINDDNALVVPTSDYNNLRNNRVINEAVRVAFNVYYRELKNDVEATAGGRMSTVAEKALEAAVETAIDQQLRGQMSKKKDGTADVNCLVNPDPASYATLYEQNNITDPNFNLLASGQVYLFIEIRPKGCIKYLNVFLGFVA